MVVVELGQINVRPQRIRQAAVLAVSGGDLKLKRVNDGGSRRLRFNWRVQTFEKAVKRTSKATLRMQRIGG